VSVSSEVWIGVSEALDPLSVTRRTAYLKRRGTPGKVEVTVRYLAGQRLIVLQPKGPLAPDATYVVIVSPSVADLAGNAWDQQPAEPGAQRLRYLFRTA
jgi:hypothetical protein